MYGHGYFCELSIDYWQNRSIRYYDAFPAVCYAFGIENIPNWMLTEKNLTPEWNIEKQIKFIQEHAIRQPNRVFEIGAGKGEIACTLQYLNIKIDSCELDEDAKEWFLRTAQHFFGYTFRPTYPMLGKIHTLDIDWSLYDTILMVECLEHIKEEEFSPVWDKIRSNFTGRFIVTNLIGFHPIAIGGDWEGAELHHCRLVDDKLYDTMSNDAKVILRQGSHLVLEF